LPKQLTTNENILNALQNTKHGALGSAFLVSIIDDHTKRVLESKDELLKSDGSAIVPNHLWVDFCEEVQNTIRRIRA
jgi:hypothetical protein